MVRNNSVENITTDVDVKSINDISEDSVLIRTPEISELEEDVEYCGDVELLRMLDELKSKITKNEINTNIKYEFSQFIKLVLENFSTNDFLQKINEMKEEKEVIKYLFTGWMMHHIINNTST